MRSSRIQYRKQQSLKRLRSGMVTEILFWLCGMWVSTAALAQGTNAPGKLAIYYGFPSSVNQTFNVDSAAAVFADYDLVIFAGVLQFPQYTDSTGADPFFGCTQNRHLDHDNTVAIINQLNTTYNVPVFGYVSLGGENTFSACGALPFEGTVIKPDDPLQIKGGMKERIDRWADMGATGIFLDEAGYDFGTNRERQNQVVDYVHSKGLSVFINAYLPEDVFGSEVVGTVTYPSGSSLGGQPSSYPMNPDSLPTHLGANDIFLLESFAIIQGEYQLTGFWQDRSDKMLYYRQQFGTKVATVTTTRNATCDPDSFGTADQAQFEYAWWATLLYRFDYMGWGEGKDFSASDSCNGKLPFRPRPNPGAIGQVVQPVTVGHDLNRHVRATTTGLIELDSENHTGQFTPGFPPGNTDPCQNPPMGITSWWPAEGNAVDVSGGHNGTLTAEKSWFADGKVGKAFSFDGLNDVIPLGTGPSITGTGEFTIEGWIKTSADGVIIQQRDANSVSGQYIFSVGELPAGFPNNNPGRSGKVSFGTYDGGSFGLDFFSNRSVDDGQFHHVAVVRESDGTGKIYIDAVLDTFQLPANPLRNLQPIGVFIGADTRNNAQFFYGLIDELTLYDRALTSAEIQSVHTAGSGGKCLDPLEADKSALIALYNATNGAGWTDNSNWLSPDVSTWHGVTVAGGRVTRLQLEFNNLSGTLPAELGNLTALQLLRMNNNQLSGAIPAELGGLAALTELNLGHNQLTGSIPAALGSMSSLTNLTVWHNQLDSGIPAALGSLGNLTVLRLAYNQLSSAIPATLGDLSNLRSVQAEFNQLSGNIPPELGNLAALQSLRLNNNQLDGSLPPELGDLAALTEMNLGHNQLSGSIPSSLGNLSNLTNLTLWVNNLSGSIPASLGDLSSLTVLRLATNQLSGSIPPELGDLSNLIQFHLFENQLSGSIPAELGSLTSLRSLILFVNQLTDTIPSELGNLVNLTELRMGNNQLTGSIPASLGDLSNLTNLTLWYNELSGDVPASLGNLSSLTVLRLAANNLTGSIPPELGSLTNLTDFQLYQNQLSGSIPPELGNLTSLVNLRLFINQLSGNIPAELGDLVALERMELGNNQLSGSIPNSLGSLANLTNLSLWHNQLSGDVPASFTGLSSLTSLRLSDNKLVNLPDLSSLTTLSDFHVFNNRFTFEDLEPNAGVSGFNYSPQAKVGTTQTFALSPGESINLSIPVGGSANNYQWFKGNAPVPGANNDSYSIASLTAADFGDYTLQITNPFLPQLTLFSNKKRVLQGTIEVQNIIAGDPPPATFSTSGVTLDFSSLDADASVDVTQYQAEPLNVPVFFQPQLGSYWNIEQQGATAFTTEVCFSLAGLDSSVDPQDIQLLKREDESGPWNTVSTVLKPDANNPTEICAENISDFSDFVFAVRMPPTIADQFVDEECQANISAADVIGIPDPEGLLNVTVSPANLALGDNTVTITVDDGGAVYDEVVTVSVADTTAPAVTLNGHNPMTLVRYGSPYAEPGATVSDNCDANPSLTISGTVDVNIFGTYSVTYQAVDQSGNQQQVTRTVNVIDDPNTLSHPFLYLAESKILLDKTSQSGGSIHSNGSIDIKKGPSTFSGNIAAVGAIDIAKDVTIDGDVTAGGQLTLANNVSISGDATANASVSAVVLPSIAFSAGGTDVTVHQNETLALLPGSYGKLLAETGATLQLSAGDYFFDAFVLKKDALLEIDLSENPVTVNVASSIEFHKDVAMTLLPLGDMDSRYATFNSLGDIYVYDSAVLHGVFNAPGGTIYLHEDVHLVGVVCAREIDVDKNVEATHPDKLLPLAKTASGGEGDKPTTDQKEELPRQFALSQNYPNPFNPSTTLTFALPKPAFVSLKIYNALGQLVRTLVHDHLPAGLHNAIWDGKDDRGVVLASGTYFYRIKAADFTAVKKMIYLR